MLPIFKTLKYITNHPLTKHNKLKAINRFLKWQITSSLTRLPVVYSFINESKLIIEKGMAGATGNIYVGLMEYKDMSFLLHLLREDDCFIDIGANVGSYTILASSVKKATTIAIEPIPSTYNHLMNNININQLQNKVIPLNIGLGSKNSKLFFTTSLDSMNHVVSETDNDKNKIEVNVKKLDDIVGKNNPILIKIDVEGFETEILKGAENCLNDQSLKAIIIELNESGKKYGYEDNDIHNKLLSLDFKPFDYNPKTRSLLELESYETGNTIYIKDTEFIKQRLESADKFKVLDQEL